MDGSAGSPGRRSIDVVPTRKFSVLHVGGTPSATPTDAEAPMPLRDVAADKRKGEEVCRRYVEHKAWREAREAARLRARRWGFTPAYEAAAAAFAASRAAAPAGDAVAFADECLAAAERSTWTSHDFRGAIAECTRALCALTWGVAAARADAPNP